MSDAERIKQLEDRVRELGIDVHDQQVQLLLFSLAIFVRTPDQAWRKAFEDIAAFGADLEAFGLAPGDALSKQIETVLDRMRLAERIAQRMAAE